MLSRRVFCSHLFISRSLSLSLAVCIEFIFALGLMFSLTQVRPIQARPLLSTGPTVITGAAPFVEQDIGIRLRSFATGSAGQEIFLGIPDLGNGANRIQTGLAWSLGITCNQVTFKLDRANDRLETIVFNGSITNTLVYTDLSNKLIAKGKTRTLDDLNVMQLAVTLRDSESTVNFQNVFLDGNLLGNFPGVFNIGQTWTIRNYDFGSAAGFSLTGQLCLTGSLSNGENSKIEITAGYLTPNIDLVLTKTGPDSILPGQNITYTLTTQNSGQDIAKNIILDDPTPPGLSLVAAGAPCEGGFPCNLGQLSASDSTTLTLTYAVPASYAGSNPIINTASVTSIATETNTLNNTATATATIPPPELSLTKVVNTLAPFSGQRITYTITIQNSGPVTATNALVVDTLDSNLTLAGAVTVQGTSGSVGTPPLLASGLTIGPGAAITVTFPVSVNLNSAGLTIINTAAVTSTEVTIPITNSVAILVGNPALPNSLNYLPLILKNG